MRAPRSGLARIGRLIAAELDWWPVGQERGTGRRGGRGRLSIAGRLAPRPAGRRAAARRGPAAGRGRLERERPRIVPAGELDQRLDALVDRRMRVEQVGEFLARVVD